VRPRILDLVSQHGGVERVHTHPVTAFNRRTGAYDTRGWVNTIVCRDGWKRRLTKREEVALARERAE